jgi:hypothetical protein
MKTMASVIVGLGVVCLVAAVLGMLTPSLLERGVTFIVPFTSVWLPLVIGVVLIVVGIVVRKRSVTGSGEPQP